MRVPPKFKYFHECKNLTEVRKVYIKLSLLHHPDRQGGNTAIMQEINNEYEYAIKKTYPKETTESNQSEPDQEAEILNMEAYREAINKVINLAGINIEVVGTWIWVTGITTPHAAILNSYPAKFNWARKKTDMSAWFFRTDENKCKKTYGKKLTLDQIRERHGSQTVNRKFSTNLL